MRWLLPLLLGFCLMLAFSGTRHALGQHPPEHQDLHEKFYQTWKIPSPGPDHRTNSCCSNKDCYPTETRMRGGKWEYLHRETGNWYLINPARIEQNQIDPRESPDGRSHICANASSGYVYCAVLGSGI